MGAGNRGEATVCELAREEVEADGDSVQKWGVFRVQGVGAEGGEERAEEGGFGRAEERGPVEVGVEGERSEAARLAELLEGEEVEEEEEGAGREDAEAPRTDVHADGAARRVPQKVEEGGEKQRELRRGVRKKEKKKEVRPGWARRAARQTRAAPSGRRGWRGTAPGRRGSGISRARRPRYGRNRGRGPQEEQAAFGAAERGAELGADARRGGEGVHGAQLEG